MIKKNKLCIIIPCYYFGVICVFMINNYIVVKTLLGARNHLYILNKFFHDNKALIQSMDIIICCHGIGSISGNNALLSYVLGLKLFLSYKNISIPIGTIDILSILLKENDSVYFPISINKAQLITKDSYQIINRYSIEQKAINPIEIMQLIIKYPYLQYI